MDPGAMRMQQSAAQQAMLAHDRMSSSSSSSSSSGGGGDGNGVLGQCLAGLQSIFPGFMQSSVFSILGEALEFKYGKLNPGKAFGGYGIGGIFSGFTLKRQGKGKGMFGI